MSNPNYPDSDPTSAGMPNRSRTETQGTYGTTPGTTGAQYGSGEGLGEQAAHLKEKAVDAASHIAGAARQQVASQVENQKDKTAASLVAVADGLRRTGGELRDKNEQTMQQLLDMAADQVDRFSDYLRSNSVGDFVDDVEQFARRRPGIFFGGAVVLGLLGARFVKSTSPRRERMREPRRYAGRMDEENSTLPYGTPRPQAGSMARDPSGREPMRSEPMRSPGAYGLPDVDGPGSPGESGPTPRRGREGREDLH